MPLHSAQYLLHHPFHDVSLNMQEACHIARWHGSCISGELPGEALRPILRTDWTDIGPIWGGPFPGRVRRGLWSIGPIRPHPKMVVTKVSEWGGVVLFFFFYIKKEIVQPVHRSRGRVVRALEAIRHIGPISVRYRSYRSIQYLENCVIDTTRTLEARLTRLVTLRRGPHDRHNRYLMPGSVYGTL